LKVDNLNADRTKLPTVSIRELEDRGLRTPEITAIQERRNRFRFQMNAELRYQVAGGRQGNPIRGTGKVENISSKALAFRTDGPVERGMRLSVSLAWPATLDNQCRLRLGFEGIVLRTRGNLVVLTIERPEFRTAGKGAAASRAEIAGTVGGIQKR
jgi:hypothetical protein